MRINPLIARYIEPEYKVLWEAVKNGMSIKDRNLRRMLQDKISRARSYARDSQGPCRLEHKLMSFGNTGGYGLHKIQELSRLLYQDKRPGHIDLGQWLSIELELIMPNKGAEASFVSHVRKMGLSNAVTIKDDGSVKVNRSCDCDNYESNDDGEPDELIHEDDCNADDATAYGREIVVTVKYGQWDIIKSLCSKLNEIGCKVNKTCGLHVHFDMRHLENRRKMQILATRVAKVVPALKQMLPASRQDNEYCSRVINRFSDSDSSRYSRYAFVNVKAYDRHKTLEIRGHSGTTDANKIINWIRILHKVMATPIRSQITTVEGMFSKFNFDTDLQVYMLARKAKFASVGRQRDDVSSDNHAAETGTREQFTIGSIAPAPTANAAATFEYAVTLNGQTFGLTESELEQALNVDTALLARQFAGQAQSVPQRSEVA